MNTATPDLGGLVVTRTMHERKAAIADAADTSIALPGGFGTFDELCEVLEKSNPTLLLDRLDEWKPQNDAKWVDNAVQ